MRKPDVMRFGSAGVDPGLATDGKAEIKLDSTPLTASPDTL